MHYKKAAQFLGVDEASIKSVAMVESSGYGFLTNSLGEKVPKILFERHIMFRRIRDFTPIKSKDVAAKYPDIVNEKPGGYKGGLPEHERLQRAVLIDRVTALESASWGSFQIMGYHWKTLGYPSIQAFVNDMYTEQGQLDAFVKFIKADKRLVKALQEKDWTTFARLFNGPAYKKNNYDVRLARAYEKFSSDASSENHA